MKTYTQPGNTVTAPAPVGGVTSGQGVSIGALFGVATYAAAAGEPVELATVGVFDLAKASGATFALGDPVYWDAAEKKATDDDSNWLIGCAMAVAGSSATIARVRLNGVFGLASQAAVDDLTLT